MALNGKEMRGDRADQMVPVSGGWVQQHSSSFRCTCKFLFSVLEKKMTDRFGFSHLNLVMEKKMAHRFCSMFCSKRNA